jgi:hypothetical protein
MMRSLTGTGCFGLGSLLCAHQYRHELAPFNLQLARQLFRTLFQLRLLDGFE